MYETTTKTDVGGPMHKQIKDRRKELKLSLRALAEKVGVTHQAISDWEKGIYPATREAFFVLREVLSLPGKYEDYFAREAAAGKPRKYHDHSQCKVEGCEDKPISRGMCRKHYQIDRYHRMKKEAAERNQGPAKKDQEPAQKDMGLPPVGPLAEQRRLEILGKTSREEVSPFKALHKAYASRNDVVRMVRQINARGFLGGKWRSELTAVQKLLVNKVLKADHGLDEC